ncbi:MAG: VCBS repeat-containing protein [Gemmataceae bacterium]|nr:VCBS repeat-containing protein [Gemmataceae bacterium]
MRTVILLAGLLVAGVGRSADPPKGGAGFPTFKPQEIDTALSIGYAVLVADIDGDKKPDIVVVDQKQVVWYQNPTWKKRVILDGKTKPDNVCAVALDIDGGGDLELVVGAGWNPADTNTPGTLQWLKRGKSLDDEWTLHPIPCDEPTVHRVRVVDFFNDGKPRVVVAPLHGRGCTAKGNYTDGRPVRIVAYPIPADPTKPENWKPEVISEELYVVHNIRPRRARETEESPEHGERWNLMAASYEGVHDLAYSRGGRLPQGKPHVYHGRYGNGNQDDPNGSRGASEAAATRIGTPVFASIEPWHGNQVVTYTRPPADELPRKWDRHVIDNKLRWGHAVWFADLDGDGTDELVIGVRDDPNPKAGDTFADRRGVRVYKCVDGKGARWDRLLVDPGGVAVEDLTVADLDADGRPDIVACGRQTKNVKIYWNQGK